MKKRILSILLCIAVIICMMPATALADSMSWEWTVTVFGGKYFRADGIETSTNKYTINQHLDNSKDHEIGYKFEWNNSAGGSIYDGGWQLCLTVDGNIVERSTAYIYTKDMSTASGTWTAPASSHTGTSSHPFTIYLRDYQNAHPDWNNLTVTKSVDKKTAKPGEEITYTIKVTNGTGKDLTGIKVLERLDANLTFVSAVPANSYDSAGGIWTIQSLENGKTATLTLKAKVNERVANNTVINNTATVTSAYSGNDSLGDNGPSSSADVTVDNPPVEPTSPTADGLKGILGDAFVTVDCVNDKIDPKHDDKTYGLLDDSYTIGEPTKGADGTYTCIITLDPAEYVKHYNADIKTDHTLQPAEQTGTITLTWDKEKGWTAPESHSVTFKVICVTPEEQGPAAPTDEDLEGILSDEFVTVECINTNATHTPKKMTYGLLLNGYKVGAVTDADGKYTCNVTFLASAYQAQYNDDTNSKHVLDPVQQAQNNATITLTWNEDGGWSAPNPNGVKFTVRCEEQQEEQTYTVTYTDGVDGQVIFADQVTNNLKSGDATPAFKGTPTRDGYTFTGWNPSVAEKVTGNATYTAKWSKNETGGGGGTVTYYTVKWNNYDNTTLETDYCTYGQMPKYDGATPVKPADDKYTYEFIGWDKEVVKVTGNAVYTAQFKAVAKEPADPVNPADPTDPTKPEKPAKPEKPQKPATPEASGNTDAEKSEVPKTADANDLMLWAALLLAAGTGLAGTALRKRKADSGK